MTTTQQVINQIVSAACLQCEAPIGTDYIQLTYYPGGPDAGRQYTLCSDRCLTRFLIGAES